MDRKRRNARHLFFYVAFLLMFGAGILGMLQLGSRLYDSRSHPQQTARPAEPTGSTSLVKALAGDFRSPLAVLLIQLSVIILAARGVGKFFRSIGQPSVIGEVVAGILLGPSLLGWLYPPTQSFLFPVHSMGTLSLLSQIGVILFMFIVGVELDLEHLREKAGAAVVVSHASIVVPLFLGIALSLYLFPRLASPGIPFGGFALFMGVAMSITAFPVLARIVSERGLATSPLGSTAIACAAVDDVTAWCLLAIVVAIIKATGLGSAMLTILLTLVFIMAMFLVVRRQTGRLFLGDSAESGRLSRVSGVLAFVFLSALVTEVIGIHALFGAFLAGVAMPSDPRVAKFVTSRLGTATSVIFLPLFFAFTGLRTQITLLNDWSSLFLCAGIIAVAIAGKIGGSAIAARWTGQSWLDALSIGTLMNTRGLVELIALNIGYDLGILPPRIFTMMVLMALVTTFMAAPALAFLDWIRRRAAAPASERPSPEPTGT